MWIDRKTIFRDVVSPRSFALSSKDVESLYEEISTKMFAGETLTDEEKKFIDEFLGVYYPKQIGGNLYPYPRYDEKLKPMYKKTAEFYLKNINLNTKGSAVFLQYYYLTEMAKEFEMTPIIQIGDNSDYFEKNPNTRAYHACEFIPGINKMVPKIVYNPKAVDKALERPDMVLDLIWYGFHEFEHEVQLKKLKQDKDIDPQALIWAKEHIARGIYGEEYYKVNYSNIFYERDAFNYSSQRLLSILNSFGLSSSYYKSFLKDFDLSVMHKDTKTKEKVLAIDLLDMIANEAMTKYPTFLDKIPVLNVIYDEKGNKKTLPQIEGELNLEKENEIKKDPSKEESINEKYKSLLAGICETDNDLEFQYLCQIAADYYSNNDTLKFEETITKIKDLLSKRDLSYEDFSKKLKERQSLIEREESLLLHGKDTFNAEKFSTLDKELKALKKLYNSAMEYNPKFKEAHNVIVMKRKIRDELRKKYHHDPLDMYKYTINENGQIVGKEKTKDELFGDYRKLIEEALDRALSAGEFKEDLDKINVVYDGVIDLSNFEGNTTRGG